MKTGILAPGITPDALLDQYGSYADMCRHLLLVSGMDSEFRIYDVFENQLPEGVDECDAWLITGSKFSAYDDLPWIAPLKQLIRDIVAAGKPLAGICFGHQIMAEALGGRVQKSSNGWGTGIHEYNLSPLAVEEMGIRSLHLNAVHQDQVVEKPAAAEVLASSPFCPYAALRYGERVLSFQAHPEFSMAFENDLLSLKLDDEALPKEVALAGLATLQQEGAHTDSEAVGRWIAKVLTVRE